MLRKKLSHIEGLSGKEEQMALKTVNSAKSRALNKKSNKAKTKRSWDSGETECNMCSKTTPHTHFK